MNKICTSLEQSRKLAEILPLESADGFWEFHTEWGAGGDKWEGYEDYPSAVPYLEYTRYENEWKEEKQDMPCWSLAALLRVLPYPELREQYNGNWTCKVSNANTTFLWEDDNPVDACVAMIIKLHEQKLL